MRTLQEYDFTISHWPRRKYQNVDALSRGPCTQCGRESNADFSSQVVDVEKENTIMVLTKKSLQNLRQMQLNDGPISRILQSLEKNEKPRSDVRQEGPEAQRLLQLWSRLLVENGVLKRRYEDTHSNSTRLQLVVPHTLREEVLEEMHARALKGHLGEVITQT